MKPKPITPQKGPQERFLSCRADIAILGGAAGGSKTFSLLMESLRNVHNPLYSAVIFRKTLADAKKAGSIWDTSFQIFPSLRGTPRIGSLSWAFPSGASISFSHLQYEKNIYDWMGAQVPLICFDELTHFSQTQFFYLLSRNRSTSGVRPYCRASCNPDPDSWVSRFLSWWIDQETGFPIPERAGVLRWMLRDGDDIIWHNSAQESQAENKKRFGEDMPGKSVTFIPAKLEDNKILMKKDPNYRANLNALGHVERSRLRDGNWKVRREAGSYFKRIWLPIVDELPTITQAIRYWDRAATEPNAQNPDPDWTAGVKFLECASGPYKYIVEDVARFRLTPGRVRQSIKATASQDGKTVMQVLEEDPGQAGKSDIDSLVEYLEGYPVDVRRVVKEKATRAIPLSAACEHGKVALLRGPWNAEYISELVAFDDGEHDDQVDASSGGYNYLEEQKQPGLRAL